jgi:hypothetical protein
MTYAGPLHLKPLDAEYVESLVARVPLDAPQSVRLEARAFQRDGTPTGARRLANALYYEKLTPELVAELDNIAVEAQLPIEDRELPGEEPSEQRAEVTPQGAMMRIRAWQKQSMKRRMMGLPWWAYIAVVLTMSALKIFLW